jgi:Cu(I)/Ag(I) efflux system membrane fusion protein/cobalt-zinc-cadmium efflux system membrane fusion protein
MNYRKLFIAALLLNFAFLGILVWFGARPKKHDESKQQQMAMPPQTQPPQTSLEAPKIPLMPIQLSPERMQSIGVTFGTVAMSNIGGEIRATGNVDMDERRQAYVQTRVTGWLRTVYVNATYQFVRKGQPLFTIYSPELVATQREYLLALKNQRALTTSSVEGVSQGASLLVGAARERLHQWDIPDAEISKIEQTGNAISELTINSPVSGFVTERNALPNMYVQPDTKLYAVADLSSVWVYAQVFQNDVGKVKTGGPAEITVDAYSGKKFLGRVDQILPQVDMNTRTVRVRLSLTNPGLLLKPGMFVNVSLKTPTGKALVVPASAVIQSGAKQMVFIDRGNGILDPKGVQLGDRLGDFYVVRSGLKNGDRVVTSANFLIDSESQLQAAAGAFTPPPPGAGGAAVMTQAAEQASAELTTDPSPPHKGSNIFRVKLTTPDGKPIDGAQVTVTFFMPAMPAMGMAEMKTTSTLQDKGNGMYERRGELGSGGTWQVVIVARQNGQLLANQQLTVSATGGM